MSIFDKLKKGNVIHFPSDYKMTEKRFGQLCVEGIQAQEKNLLSISLKSIQALKLKDSNI